jgi:hypothetical protein
MPDNREPHEIIADIVASCATMSDDQVLAEISAIAPFPDEEDPAWDLDATWQAANRYVALAQVAGSRRLKPAIRMLLDRACYGDPGSMFEGLRHSTEAIVNPNWPELAEICLGAATSARLGTRLWAIDHLTRLEDERARPIFEEAVRSDPEEIQWRAENGLERLNAKRSGSA